MNLLKTTALLCIALLISACKTTSSSHSDLSAKIASEKDFPLLFIGFLESLVQEVRLMKPTSSTICVEAAPFNKDLDPQDFQRKVLFEVKLAFSMWMDASNKYDEKTWSLINFKLDKECDREDLSYMALVALRPRVEFDFDDAKKIFNHPAYSITYDLTITESTSFLVFSRPSWKETALIKPQEITGAFASGSSYKTNGKVKKKEFIPGIYFNYVINWQTLDKRLENINTVNSKNALKNYQALVNKNTDYEDFIKFGRRLNALKIKDDETIDLKRFMDKIKIKHLGSLKKFEDNGQLKESDSIHFEGPYTKTKGIFSILLHEVGHFFGLDHPHEPGFDNIQSPLTVKAKDGSWVTDDAAMAYGDPLFYLTQDDVVGVKAAAQRVEKVIKTIKSL